jgi:COX assembly mitochondrial protein 1
MNALSRREEETLLKAAKTRALKECDPVVKGMIVVFIQARACIMSVYRVRNMCRGSDRLRFMGLQGQAQDYAELYGSVVSRAEYLRLREAKEPTAS